MGIAIDLTTESTTSPPISLLCNRPTTSFLIPELIFQIERYLEIQDLAAAALVCRTWHEAWSSSLYSTVRCHIRRTSSLAPLLNGTTSDLKKPCFHTFTAAPPAPSARDQGYLQHQYYYSLQHHHHYQQQQQQYTPPFLNFVKYGRWIRSLEVSNLYCLPSVPRTSQAGAVSSYSSPFCPSATVPLPPVQDHLSQIQTCWHLVQLDISRTVMSLERLDALLGSLPRLKVFKFEVVNKTEIATANGLHGGAGAAGGSSHGGGSPGSTFRRGYMQQQPSSLLLKKPKQVTLEGLESEVIRVIAKRLGGQLERLDLVFTVTGRIGLSTFLELLTNCRSTLKSLALTRAEVFQTDYSRERNAAMEVSALLASLLGTTSAATTSHPSFATSSSPSSPPSSISSSSSSSKPSIPPVLEHLSFNSCAIPDREFEWFLRHAPSLKELHLHDCRFLNKPAVAAILQHSPLLETLSLRSVPYIDSDALKQLFETIPRSEGALPASSWSPYYVASSHAATVASGVNGSGGASTSTTANNNSAAKERETSGLRLKSIRLAYLRQLNDTVMETIARSQGACLEKLSVQWCPHVTDVGILPIFMFCQRLQDLSLYLSKPTLNIFKDLSDELAPNTTATMVQPPPPPPTTTTATATAAAASPASAPVKRRLWACANTLERLEVGGQMFVDRIRSSSEHLQPQLYHHLSPNPHHMRSPSGNQDTALGNGNTTGGAGTNTANNGGPNGTSTNNTNNVIHDPYSIAHYQGYPMYHLWRYNRISDPFRELQAQLETLPRLKHLGVQAKGIEHLLRRGFGPKVHIQSLALLNQQGRVWSPEEIREMFDNMPHLRTLVCEKNTIMAGGQGGSGGGVVSVGGGGCGGSQPLRGVDLLKRQMRMRRILEDHRVELVQSTLTPITI